MSYYEIEKQMVYMPQDKYFSILVDELKVADYKGYYIATENGKKPEEQIKHEALIYDFLKGKYNLDHESFICDWVNFDFNQKEATINIWDLLYDYCFYYDYALLKDIRGDHQQMIDELNGDTSYHLPMGNIFALTVKAKYNYFNLKTAFKNSSQTNILINANKITRIVGRLVWFDIYYDNGSAIHCHDNISVRPF